MKTKTVSACATITLVIISVLASALMVGVSHAQGTITLSSSNLNPAKVVRIDVSGDLGDGPLNLQVLDKDGTTLNLIWADGTTNHLVFRAYKIAAGKYRAYLGGGPSAQTAGRPTADPVLDKTTQADAFGYIQVPTGLKGTYLTVEVIGTGISTTVLYDTVKLTLTFTVTDVAYRRLDFVVPFTVKDADLNWDPTNKEAVPAAHIDATLKLVKAEGGEVTYTGTLGNIISAATITETTTDSGSFSLSTTVTTLNGLLISVPGGRELAAGDKVLLTLVTTENAQGGAGWGDDPATQAGSDSFNAVYRKPTISITANSKTVTIDITSPDDNVNPLAKDHLDDQDFTGTAAGDDANVIVTVGTASYAFDCTNILETDKNTGVFRLKLSVRWGTSYAVTASAITLPVNTAGPFKIKVEYKTVQTRASGYNIDSAGEDFYTPEKASVEIVKSTIKSIILKIKDSDLNNLDTTVEWLDATFPTTNCASIYLWKPSGGPRVAILEIYDVYGNLVPANTVSGLISFVETDFDTGIFDVKIRADWLTIEAGKTYILKYTDLTGYTTVTGLMQVNIPISVIAITVDRSEIPVNLNGVYVIVTYDNDHYNTDPSKKDTAPITAQIEKVDGTTISLGATLTETDINSGVFKGKLTLSAIYFATPSIIDAKLKIWDTSYIPYTSATTATIIAHDASVEVNATNVKWGDVVKITLRDYDANTKTDEKETVSASIYLVNLPIKTLTLTETDKNTGEFTATQRISWDDLSIAGYVYPGNTLSVKYFDTTPVMSPTASAWPSPGVPYVATIKVISTSGVLTVNTAVEGNLGILEELKLGNITVTDPDQNMHAETADSMTNAIPVSIEAIPEAPSYDLTETEANSGKFILPAGTEISLYDALVRVGLLTSGMTARQRAEVLASYVGKKVTISYIDEYSAAGTREIVSETLTLNAWTATITPSAEAVNLGDWLTITLSNPDIAGTTVTTYKQLIVKSTSYPAGLVFYLEETEPGVFQMRLQVISVADWVPGAKQIPAKLGDAITIEYVDPVTGDAKANVLLTRTVTVGVPVERPVPASGQKFVDPNTGVEKTSGKVGETIMLQATFTNVDVVSKSFTAIFKVKDSAGATIYIGWSSTTLSPGGSTSVAVSWTPTAAGTYTVEVLVVKSISEPTPYSDKLSMELPVT